MGFSLMVPAIKSVEALRLAMEAAADRGDFEEAAALRDRISILRGAAPDAAVKEIDTKAWFAKNLERWASAQASSVCRPRKDGCAPKSLTP